MRILVTGATGLIGSHATARLAAQGHHVRVFVREPAKLASVLAPLGLSAGDVEVARGDVRDGASVSAALADCEGLLHCAGVFSPELADAGWLWAVNVDGTRTVLDAAVAAGLPRIVFVSSMLALFPPAGSRMTAEDAVGRPRSMYAATKAAAERHARSLQRAGAPLSIVYPAACQGPFDPTFSSGPQLVARALKTGRVLVTEGGLAYTDVRDLVRVLAALLVDRAPPPARLMGPAFFLTHERYHALLSALTGRALVAQRVPGWLLRGVGRLGDLAQRLGFGLPLTSEAAEVLTRSVPVDDREARKRLGGDALGEEASFRDLILWMHDAGLVEEREIGVLAEKSATKGGRT